MKVIFLDRDGVINRYPGDTKYVTSRREFKFLPGAREAIAKLSQNGFKIFIVSNQAGVGKGIFPKKRLSEITKKMLREVEQAGGKIHNTYYCIHRPEENCSCRKPKAGMIKRIKNKLPFNIKKTFFIGDTIRDVITAKAAGCRSILVLSGKEKLKNRKNWKSQPDFIFKNLKEAAGFILKQE